MTTNQTSRTRKRDPSREPLQEQGRHLGEWYDVMMSKNNFTNHHLSWYIKEMKKTERAILVERGVVMVEEVWPEGDS